MAYKKLWLPRKESSCARAYSTLDRPESNLSMFFNDVSTTYTNAWNDHYSGDRVNFGTTLTGGDNRLTNMTHVWRHTSGYGRTWGYTKNDAYISWHLGAIPDLHPKSSIKGYAQHLLPGYVGVRFQYRWPTDNSYNNWSNSPVHINDMMLHYYNAATDEFWHYSASLTFASDTNSDYWPDRFVRNDGRKSDSWRGCYWKPSNSAARGEIRNNQLYMIGLSVEMMYSDRGSAKHSRSMDIRNLTPIWDSGDAQKFVPVLAKPVANPWTSSSKHELYLS